MSGVGVTTGVALAVTVASIATGAQPLRRAAVGAHTPTTPQATEGDR